MGNYKHLYYAVGLLLKHLIDSGKTSYTQLSDQDKLALSGCFLSNKFDQVTYELLNEKEKDQRQSKFNFEFADVVDAMCCIDIREIIEPLSKAMFEYGIDGRVHASSAARFTKSFCKAFIRNYPDVFKGWFEYIAAQKEASDNGGIDEEREMFWFDVVERVQDMQAELKSQQKQGANNDF